MSDDGYRESARRRVSPLLSGTRFSQFVSAGLVGMVVDNLVLAGLVEFGRLDPLVAKVGSWEAAVFVIFLINEHWTFRTWGRAGLPALGRRFLQSNLVRVGGLAVTLAVLYLLHSVAGVWYLAANVVGIGVGAVVNYLFEGLYTWGVEAE